MTLDRSSGPELDADASFERWLLDSARADTVSSASVEQAWTRFAATTGALAATTSVVAHSSLCSRLARSAGLRWLLVGALGGSALTAALTSRRATPAAVPPPAAAAQQRLERSPPTIAAQPVPGAPTTASADPGSPPRSALTLRGKPPRTRDFALPEAPSVGSARGQSALPRGGAPTLMAEIRVLDATRAALEAGAPGRALRLIDEYHRDFPGGQLGTESEVLAIEALKQAGETAESTRRAAEFLQKYPKDPAAARIQAFVTASP